MRFAKRDVVLHDADTEAPTGLRVLSGRTLKGDLIVNVNAGKESSVLAYCDLIVYLKLSLDSMAAFERRDSTARFERQALCQTQNS